MNDVEEPATENVEEIVPENLLEETGTSDSKQEKLRAGRRSTVVLALILFLFAGVLGWLYFFSPSPSSDPAGKNENELVVSVRIAQAEKRTISSEVSAIGTIFPARQAVVSSNLSGQLKGLRILKDIFVKKGELLATINTSDLEAQKREAETALIEAKLNVQALLRSTIPQADIQTKKDLRDARAAVDNARNLYERRKFLYEKGGLALKDLEAAQLALTQAEDNLKYLEELKDLRTKAINPLDLQMAQARVAQAEQRIRSLQTQMNLAEIRAPISGFVVEQTQFDGEYATAGGKILTIADASEVIVKANFSDTVISDLKEGDAVAIYPNDLPGERMSGKVSLISRSTDPNNRTTEVWVKLDNRAGRLRIGGAANVVISVNTQTDAVVVPNSAVVLDDANEKTGVVMIVDQFSIARERKVEIGIRTNELTQIVSGLSGGETVIIEGNYSLPDGTRVEIIANNPKQPGEAK
ncbi:MAG: efflux RND transporter periplasmic adaptor subunit [Acidobacteriota bacterium]|nr:efflux RND transporter periplasmic adaptor subunit [Blastocatellia bacterium]MDW8238216.1 efflux RND transporter periplasmic adaptor subunit [Acidobacteriota bacterium]